MKVDGIGAQGSCKSFEDGKRWCNANKETRSCRYVKQDEG